MLTLIAQSNRKRLLKQVFHILFSQEALDASDDYTWAERLIIQSDLSLFNQRNFFVNWWPKRIGTESIVLVSGKGVTVQLEQPRAPVRS